MNIDGLLHKYFEGLTPTIEVFDDESIHRVYSDVVNLLKACPEIELSALQLLSYCFYKILDNVTDGKGMGFGLYSTLCLVRNIGIRLELHSGSHILISDGKVEEIKSAPEWQGTILYLEIHSNKEVETNAVLLNRVDVEDEFNDTFLDTEDIDGLW